MPRKLSHLTPGTPGPSAVCEICGAPAALEDGGPEDGPLCATHATKLHDFAWDQGDDDYRCPPNIAPHCSRCTPDQAP